MIWVGDKNPNYSLNVSLLKDLFPDSKYILLLRDFRDNVLSYKNVPFDLNNTGALAYRWKYYNLSAKRSLSKLAQPYLEIKYEDLVTNPEHCLNRICEHLGVTYIPEMLEFYKTIDADQRSWHRYINSPLTAENVGRWKKELTVTEVRTIESICGSAAKKFSCQVYSKPVPLDYLRIVLGYTLGVFFSMLERAISLIPYRFRIYILNTYRKMVGVK